VLDHQGRTVFFPKPFGFRRFVNRNTHKYHTSDHRIFLIARRRDVATIDAYAWALHRSGMHREAREEMKKALAIGATDPNILKHARAIEARNGMAKR